MRIITLEEHFTTPDFQKEVARFVEETPASKALQAKLLNLGDDRIEAMDAGSVDMQVLSLSASGFEKIDSATASAVVKDANNRSADAVSRYPARFAAFANLNAQDPVGAAKEFERCVQQLGFCGAILHGTTGGAFLDDVRFLPIWEAASALNVPIYLHPAPPPKAVFETYYEGLPGACGFNLSIAGWGWHAETGMHVLRLILSGLFDRFPSQQVIIGHMGENLPYSLARAAGVLGPVATHLKRSIPEYFHDNIHVTTSGYFTQAPFQCALEVVGIDRLIYSIDYPFSPNTKGKAFLDSLSLSAEDMEKFAGGNAERLLHLGLS